MSENKCPECKKGAPAYMTTFGDLMSLLLTFFVLLISMASFEPTKFAMTTQSLQGAFGVLQSFPTVPVMPFQRIPKFTGDEQKKKQSLKDAEKVKQTIESKQLDDAVKVKVTDTGIHIQLNDPVGFSSGSADLQEKGAQIIREIGSIIKSNSDLKIRVEGHTDDVPVRGGRYGSNWELSSARSLTVVKLVSDATGINPANMSAVGYGEFRPIVENINAENRARNRRIEIFVDYIDK
jgi:chemotaxis protein MotB